MSNTDCEIKISHVPLAAINLADTQYRISRENEDITSLAQSIKEIGLTSLPFVRSQGNSYIVVSGFKRITALVRNGFTGIVVCQTIPGASKADSAVRAVSDNAFQRQLTPGELVQSILLLGRFLEPDLIAKNSLFIFNTRFSLGHIKDLQKIGTLPQNPRELMDDGRLSIKAAKKISNQPMAIANCFMTLFSRIKSSSSKQMEIITNFLEISARENISPIDLYQEKEIQEILDHDNKDLGFKGNLLRSHLVKRRFPFLEKKRRDIGKKINSLKLGSGIKLEVPDNFEGMTYSCSFDFKTSAEFTSQVAFLDKISSHPGLEDILTR